MDQTVEYLVYTTGGYLAYTSAPQEDIWLTQVHAHIANILFCTGNESNETSTMM